MTAPWSLPLILTGRPLFTGVFGALLLFSACTDEGTPPADGPLLSLRALDASCTEVWLEVRLAAGVSPRTISLLRDSLPILTTTLRSTDTLVVDEGLSPNRRYAYSLTQPGGLYTGPASATIVTMDTTSHEWSFDPPVYFGDGTFSELVDVAIINDTLAYAVGEIYLRDSTGQVDPNAYNLLKWNGVSWHLMRIQFYTFCGQPHTGSYPVSSIFAFSATDIWIAMAGSQVVHWNGQTQSLPMCTPVSINRLWGENANSMWAVGANGGIAHFDGSMWQRLESGTTVTINDVWGGSSRWVGENVVLAAASFTVEPGEKKLLRIHGDGEVETLPWPMQDRPLHSVWFDGRSRIFTAGSGVFQYSGGGRWSEQPLPGFFTTRIRGGESNTIWVVGHFGLAAHFNGVTWRDHPGLRINGIYHSAAVTQNTVIAVGYVGRDAVIVRGRRR